MFNEVKSAPAPVTKAQVRIDEYLRVMRMYPISFRDKSVHLRAWSRTKSKLENQTHNL